MNVDIPIFESKTDWIPSGAEIEVPAENEIKQFIAGFNNTKSLILKFNIGSGTALASVSNTFTAVDTTKFDEMVFHIETRNKKAMGLDFRKASDFVYKIGIFDGVVTQEFLIPTFNTFTDLTFDISTIDSIERITITPLHDDEDFLILSHMTVIREQTERDIMDFVKTNVQDYINSKYRNITDGVDGKGVLLGTVTASAGATSISITGNKPWLEKYVVILIDDGANSETHQIDEISDTNMKFNSLFDEKKLKFSHTNANVYLIIPVAFGQHEKEIFLPGIAIWNMTPEPFLRSNKEDSVFDSMEPSGLVKVRKERQPYTFSVLIDIESRAYEPLAYASRRVRDFIAGENLWLNGRRYRITFDGSPSFVEQTESTNEIPKVQYQMSIEIYEDIFERESLVPVTLTNQTYKAILNT